MLTILNEADICVHPSVTHKTTKEGIPGSVIEAMANGLPIISTYHAGISYAIETEKTGILVKEWDINELAHSILRLIESVELREKIGSAAQIHAINDLNLLKKESELEEIYINLI